jgi:CRP-like cAMP-binding protein
LANTPPAWHDAAMDAKQLEGVPLFDGLSRKEREHVARWADVIDLPSGYHLADQGAFAHEFFALLDGTVEVTRNDERLVELGPGDFFGEIALVEHDRRTATVTAITPITAIVMHERDFDAMRIEFPQIAARIHEAVHARSPRHDDG